MVDVAMLDGYIVVLENTIVRYAIIGEVLRPIGSKCPSIIIFNGFKAKGLWIIHFW